MRALAESLPPPGSEELKKLSRTYGYLWGQQFTLDRIEKAFPDMATEVRRCEMEFSLSFGKAEQRITDTLKLWMGNEFYRYKTQMKEQIESLLANQSLSREVARNFLGEVYSRAKGEIESPVLEVLLTYQFMDAPHLELLRGYRQVYTTRGHPKAKGLSVKIEVPRSWKPEEASRPNIVQIFVSRDGNGLEMMTLMVKDLGLPSGYQVTDEELDEFFSEAELKQLVPNRGEFISARQITLDGRTGGLLIYKETRNMIDQSITSQSVHFFTIYEGKLITLQGATPIKNSSHTAARFDRYYPLFKLVATSLVIMDQY